MTSLVDQLCLDYWNWRISSSPEFASFVGIHDHDDQLDDLSHAAIQARHDSCLGFLGRVEELEGQEMSRVDKVNIKALKHELQTFITGFPFKGYLLPLSFMEGIHVDFPRLISWMHVSSVRDFDNLLARYRALPRQLGQVETLMRRGVEEGVVCHAVSMEGVVPNLEQYVVKAAEDSPLWQPFITMPDSIDARDQERLRDAARTTIVQTTSAFRGLMTYVRDEYTTRPDIAASSLPNGTQLYDQLIRFHSLTDYTAAEIHEIGLAEVRRIQGEMAKVVKELGHDMTVQEFSDMIRNDPRQYHTSPDDLLAAFKDLAKRIRPKMTSMFDTIPKAEMLIQGDPNPNRMWAFYEAGSYDGTREGVFMVGTHSFNTVPKYGMVTLSLHEGNPGHHLHRSYCRASSIMPFFRRIMEDRNYCHAPSRFPINTAFGEGWALYAETLGFEMGFFQDPIDRFGHYVAEIFRACRLVVDTGMHAMGWSRQQAVDYMFLNTSETRDHIEKEVKRYITIPGQALGYKIGQLKILGLRKRAEEALGDAFDIKVFHRIVMDSTGPLSLLEEQVEEWIAAGGRTI